MNLNNLPRTLEFTSNEGQVVDYPLGFPMLKIIDQTRLPYEESYLYLCDWHEVIDAIAKLKVRGAPAIGVAGAAAVALRAAEYAKATFDEKSFSALDDCQLFVIDQSPFDPELYRISLEFTGNLVKAARPTAVNLAWAVDRILARAQEVIHDALEDRSDHPDGEITQQLMGRRIADDLFDFVKTMEAEDEKANRAIGAYGADLLGDHCRMLTHCNAGSLATVFYGTALGVIYSAADEGKIERVYADETRPVNQGARLTAWELSRVGIPVTLICDSMAASLMARREIDAVIVGADRIAANGDVANKIGTYGLAIAANYHEIPFYVAAPLSTIDFDMDNGSAIPIEHRDGIEVIDPKWEGLEIYNPAFDVTPASLVSAIITEAGVYKPSELKARLL